MNKINVLAESITEKNKVHALRQIIKRKKTMLGLLSSKFEMLNYELDQIKREYYLRVGSLIEKDNKLDTDIIIHKSILSYMKSGMNYKDALEKVRSRYTDNDGFTFDEEEIFDRKTSIQENETDADNALKLKQLWKRAVMKFHPDLATDTEEKSTREDIMKRINAAYANKDYDTLRDLITNIQMDSTRGTTAEELERIIVDLENKIIRTKHQIKDLRKTEWYGWRAKIRLAKKSNVDIFKELEKSLLDDIVRKMRLLRELKQEIEHI